MFNPVQCFQPKEGKSRVGGGVFVLYQTAQDMRAGLVDHYDCNCRFDSCTVQNLQEGAVVILVNTLRSLAVAIRPRKISGSIPECPNISVGVCPE